FWVSKDAGLRAAVKKVDGCPLPGHRPRETRNLSHRQRRTHPSSALAHTSGRVVDDKDAAHSTTGIADAHDFLRAPIVHRAQDVHVSFALMSPSSLALCFAHLA